MQLPKHLVEYEPDPALHEGWDLDYPARPVWIARLRHPFALARITLTGDILGDEAVAMTVGWWPVVLPIPWKKRGHITDTAARFLAEFYDLCPEDIFTPVQEKESPEPPEMLHLWAVDDREFILLPHVPRLYQLEDLGRDGEQITWVPGWGEPITGNPFEETRRIQAWLQKG